MAPNRKAVAPAQAPAAVKAKATEQRVKKLESATSGLAPLNVLATNMSSSQLSALSGIPLATLTALESVSSSMISALNNWSSTQFAAAASVTTSQYNLLSSTNISFLSGLSKLPNQSNSNSSLTGVENFCNNLSTNMQANGFMS